MTPGHAELSNKIAAIVSKTFNGDDHFARLSQRYEAADAVLALPEIRRALAIATMVDACQPYIYTSESGEMHERCKLGGLDAGSMIHLVQHLKKAPDA